LHIESIEKKKSFLGGKMTLKIDDYKMLVDMAKQGVKYLIELKNPKRKLLI